MIAGKKNQKLKDALEKYTLNNRNKSGKCITRTSTLQNKTRINQAVIKIRKR
jgi:hypothetical protein